MPHGTVGLDLAGWRVRLVCTPDALAEAAAARYAAFVAAGDGPCDLVVAVSAQPASGTAAQSGSLLDAALTPDGTGYRLAAGDAAGSGVAGSIATATGQAALQIDAAEPLGHLELFLRIAVALLAFRDGGVLLHAAGLLTAGRAILFTGASGSGKTTVVALSPQATALSDDLVVLRPGAAGWTAYGTPFWNPETAARPGQTASGPVAGIYRLVKDQDVYVEALSPAAAAAELVANCPVVNGRPELLPRCWPGVAAWRPRRRCSGCTFGKMPVFGKYWCVLHR